MLNIGKIATCTSHQSDSLQIHSVVEREPLNQLICISSTDPHTKYLNEPTEVMMNLRVQAKLPSICAKLEGPTSRSS
jgi:hypothetical protein